MSETVNELPGFDEIFFQEANHIIESVPIEQRPSKAYEIVCLQRNCRERQLAAEQEKVRVLREALGWVINDIQDWCDCVAHDASWDSWDSSYKSFAYGGLDKARTALASTDDQLAKQKGVSNVDDK